MVSSFFRWKIAGERFLLFHRGLSSELWCVSHVTFSGCVWLKFGASELRTKKIRAFLQKNRIVLTQDLPVRFIQTQKWQFVTKSRKENCASGFLGVQWAWFYVPVKRKDKVIFSNTVSKCLPWSLFHKAHSWNTADSFGQSPKPNLRISQLLKRNERWASRAVDG